MPDHEVKSSSEEKKAIELVRTARVEREPVEISVKSKLPAFGGTALTITAALRSPFTSASASGEFWIFHPGGAVSAMPSGS